MQKKSLRILLVLAAAAAALGAQATCRARQAPGPKGRPSAAMRARQEAAPHAPGQAGPGASIFEFSYSGGYLAGNYGDGVPGAIQACLRLDDPALKGMKITGVRVPELNVNSADVDWCRVWAATAPSRTHDLGEADAALSLTGAVNPYTGVAIARLDGTFAEPITVGNEPIYVGYTLNVPDPGSSYDAGYPISMSMPVAGQDYTGAGTSFLCAPDEDEFGEYSGQGALTAVVLLRNDNTNEAEVSVKGLVSVPCVSAGAPLRLVADVRNIGTEVAESIGYTYECAGQTAHGEASLPVGVGRGVYGRCEVAVDLPAVADAGTYPATLTFDTVNGKPNASPRKAVSFSLRVNPAVDAAALNQTEKLRPATGGNTIYNTMGYQYRGRYDQAVKVEHPTLTGMKVVGMRVRRLGYNGMGNYNGWISAELGDEGPSERTYGSLDADGNLYISFAEPAEVPAEGLYVGYSMDSLYPDDSWAQAKPEFSAGQLPFIENAKLLPGACWTRYTGGYGWEDYADFAGYGAPITVYLTGQTQPDNMMVASMEGNTLTLKDAPLSFDFEVANCGSNPVDEITYSYTIDGVRTQKELKLPEPMERVLARTRTLSIDLGDAPDTQGRRDITFSIDKVNGEPNSCLASSLTFPLSVLDYAPHHRPLMEEATGTWCGYCPRGALGMRELAKAFGDDYIGASYHNGDNLTVTEYYPWDADGLPGSAIDRNTGNIDPFFGSAADGADGGRDMGIADDFRAARAALAPCDIDIASSWADEAHTALQAEATLYFALDDPRPDYKIGYLLVADGYTFPGDKNWTQANYFSGEDHAGSMLQEYAELPDHIMDYVWDDVVIDATAAFGVDESVPGPVKLGEPVKHRYTFQTASSPSLYGGYDLMERRDAARVIAFVVDGGGRVLNARMAAAGQATGIQGIEACGSDAGASAPVYYNLQGQRLSGPQRGIVIRVQGGRATKLIL